jgi:hypothetical protein
MTGAPVILVNRIGEVLNFVADGQHYVLQPGENYGFNEAQAPFAIRQNPLMGSEDYYTLDSQSLVGIKGQTDCTPLSDEVLLAAMDCVERFDREKSGLRKGTKVRGRVLRGRSDVATNANLSTITLGG